MMRPLGILISLMLLSSCQQPSATPAAAKKTASVEAKFVPENPNFPESGDLAAETDDEKQARDYWNTVPSAEGTPIPSADYTELFVLPIPFGVSLAEFEAQLPEWRTPDTRNLPPLYDPSLQGVAFKRWLLPDPQQPGAQIGALEVAAGFADDRFGDLRLHWDTPPADQRWLAREYKTLAASLIERYGPTTIEREQVPDPATGTYTKTVTLTWPIVEASRLTGFLSYQVTYTGSRAGSAAALLTDSDRLASVSLTTMTPEMMSALKAAATASQGSTS